MTPWRVLLIFLGLGCRSFGGPVAHLALFRDEFVQRRAWLSERAYADLVALCQFLPGPTSSQVGMALGWRQAGAAGMLAAWIGFTLPGALLLTAAGLWAVGLEGPAHAGWIHGMKLAVLAIVTGAVAAMWRQLCPDRWRGALALAVAAGVLVVPQAWMQLPVLAVAGALGWFLPPPAAAEPAEPAEEMRVPGRVAVVVCLALLAAGLLVLPWIGGGWGATAADTFRAGSLVVGGGHVVLPLLTADLVATGRLPAETFLAGYGLAQAAPGPMFNIAAYVGAALHGPVGAAMAVVAIFLPGALLLLAALPTWERLRRHATARRVADGLCAGVVGLLLAALYDPIAVAAVHGPADAAWACLALAALVLRLPPWALVALCAAAGAMTA